MGDMTDPDTKERPSSAVAFRICGVVFDTLSRSDLPQPHVRSSRCGSRIIIFAVGQRMAIYECDGDGEVVLTLTSYAPAELNQDVSVDVLDPSEVAATVARVKAFLGIETV